MDDDLTARVIGLAIQVHRRLGPGLLESVYEECLCFEFNRSSVSYNRQHPIAVVYDGVKLDCGFRIDLTVEQKLIVELKSVDKLLPLHTAQLVTYLRLSGLKLGLLINFNAHLLKDGIRRVIN